eukprot:TRINITY_DN3687_c0_g1_i1.p1 TRINITY_DN3687_c0_g1~~TRINITY_DN3687_c0_g1_i1.p1  ORF type:complete len:517 (+),score=104.43 TRINITY_DN3687_c0_g1_i1:193-1551(+)
MHAPPTHSLFTHADERPALVSPATLFESSVHPSYLSDVPYHHVTSPLTLAAPVISATYPSSSSAAPYSSSSSSSDTGSYPSFLSISSSVSPYPNSSPSPFPSTSSSSLSMSTPASTSSAPITFLSSTTLAQSSSAAPITRHRSSQSLSIAPTTLPVTSTQLDPLSSSASSPLMLQSQSPTSMLPLSSSSSPSLLPPSLSSLSSSLSALTSSQLTHPSISPALSSSSSRSHSPSPALTPLLLSSSSAIPHSISLPPPIMASSDGSALCGAGLCASDGAFRTILRSFARLIYLDRIGTYFTDILVSQLNRGLSPSMLAKSVSFGIIGGTFPVPATTILICSLLAWLFRLNVVVVHTTNMFLTPLQMAMMFPLIRFGELLFFVSEPLELSGPQLMHNLGSEFLKTMSSLSSSFFRATVAWVVLSFVMYPFLHWLFLPLAKVVVREWRIGPGSGNK